MLSKCARVEGVCNLLSYVWTNYSVRSLYTCIHIIPEKNRLSVAVWYPFLLSRLLRSSKDVFFPAKGCRFRALKIGLSVCVFHASFTFIFVSSVSFTQIPPSGMRNFMPFPRNSHILQTTFKATAHTLRRAFSASCRPPRADQSLVSLPCR